MRPKKLVSGGVIGVTFLLITATMSIAGGSRDGEGGGSSSFGSQSSGHGGGFGSAGAASHGGGGSFGSSHFAAPARSVEAPHYSVVAPRVSAAPRVFKEATVPRRSFNEAAPPTRNLARNATVRSPEISRANVPAPAPARVTRSARTRTVDPAALGQAFARSGFNRENRFGGRWVPWDAHRGWDRGRIHCWHHHFFCFLDGGWVFFDGFWPDTYDLSDYDYHPDYVSGYGDEMVSDVQVALRGLGYYHGSISGVLDTETSAAISDYEVDAGLADTGGISGVLLDRLGLP